MKPKTIITIVLSKIRAFLKGNSMYDSDNIEPTVFIKNYSTYGVILVLFVSIFCYSFTKYYYAFFNYYYFQRQETLDIYWFTFNKLEPILVLLEITPMLPFIIIPSIAVYIFMREKVNQEEHKEEHKEEQVKPKKIENLFILGYFISLLAIILPFIFAAYILSDSTEGAKLVSIFTFLTIAIILLPKKRFGNFNKIIILTIILFNAGHKLGVFFAKNTETSKDRFYLEENGIVHLDYIDSEQNCLLFEHKYIIGENTVNYIIYNEREEIFEDVKKSKVTSRKIKRIKK
jgi:hypothetical protein